MMELGLFVSANEFSMPIAELARAAEDRGFDSIWIPEHSHIPVNTAFARGGEVPRDYKHTYDPFVALSVAAGATSTLKLGTGICLIIQRDTIMTAKEVATLDRISNGRFQLGIGGGWNRAEMENHGTDYSKRFEKMGDQIKAMKTIWAEEEATYHGEFVNFDAIWSWPKPVQTPNPPVWLGGESIHTLRRVVDYCDGWLPRAMNPDAVFEGMATLDSLADEAGRDPIPVSVFAPPPKTLDQYRDAGVVRSILMLPADNTDETLRRLDRYAELSDVTS
jgi:probable F420-dependent oxidoreductase